MKDDILIILSKTNENLISFSHVCFKHFNLKLYCCVHMTPVIIFSFQILKEEIITRIIVPGDKDLNLMIFVHS